MRLLSIVIAVLLSTPTALALEERQPSAPTHAEVAYGPYELNKLDFWQAEGEGPRPLLVYIHGGGW
ncbi:MAG: alpha/beta hydrolase, partial [Planctomycetota bacterium]